MKMGKKWFSIIVVAAFEVPDALGIRAPKVVPVGKEVTMSVFQRGTKEPVEGAGIWALTRNEAGALRKE